MAPRHHRRDHAGLAEEYEPLPVADVESLELVATVGVNDSAVGENTIDVHRDQAHAGESDSGHASHVVRSVMSRSTTNGSAITASVTSSTSVSPKLYSKRPLTRNA